MRVAGSTDLGPTGHQPPANAVRNAAAPIAAIRVVSRIIGFPSCIAKPQFCRMCRAFSREVRFEFCARSVNCANGTRTNSSLIPLRAPLVDDDRGVERGLAAMREN